MKIWETAKLIEFGSSFGPKTFLLLCFETSEYGNFDVNCRRLQLNVIYLNNLRSEYFLKGKLSNMIKNCFYLKFAIICHAAV